VSADAAGPAAGPPPPPGDAAPGWYSLDPQTNAQAYWDGQDWSKTRHWRGTGWVEDSAERIPAGTAAVYSSSYAAITRPPRYQSTAGGPPVPPASPMSGSPPTAGNQRPAVQTTSGLAIASLVLSILGLFGIGSLLGIIFGYKARREIRESRGSQGGDGLALAGIVVGFVTLVSFALVVAFWIAAFATIRSASSPLQTQAARCQSDVQAVNGALAAYHADTGSLPIPTSQWNSASYLSNYGLLTTGTQGDTFLAHAPPTSHYVIEYDSAGNVWVAPANTFELSYTSGQDVAVNGNACQAAVTG